MCKKYSLEYLERASQEDLNTYLNKAKKLKKTGKILNIVGGISYGAVVISAILGADWGFGVDSWVLIGIASGGLIVGGTSFIIGIPVLIVGKKRVEKIKTFKKTVY